MKKNYSSAPFSEALAIHLNISFAPTNSTIGHPQNLQVKLQASETSNDSTYEPLPYYTDAIIGLSAVKLFLHTQDSLSSNIEAMAPLLWHRLEPLHEIYKRSNERIEPLLSHQNKTTDESDEFEETFWSILGECCDSEEIRLADLVHLIDAINYFEGKRGRPFIFDTQLTFNPETLNALHTLYSLLYNLRGLLAYQYNSQIKDSVYGSLQIDSVKDYFHAADLLTNEAMLYFHFISLQKAGSLKGQSVESLGQAFRNFLPYSHFLVSALPEGFFTRQNPEMLEQSLYAFQIDWLLGTPAGLLYRLREELIGLREGYENSFWPELQNEWTDQPLENIDVNCLIDSAHIRHVSSVA